MNSTKVLELKKEFLKAVCLVSDRRSKLPKHMHANDEILKQRLWRAASVLRRLRQADPRREKKYREIQDLLEYRMF